MLFRHRGMWDGSLGEIQTAHHRIDVSPGIRPVHCQPYRTGPRARAAEEAEVSRKLDQGVIEPAMTDWESPVVLVLKYDGSLRL